MSGDQPQPSNALKRWELENNVQEASASDMDALYRYDADEQKAIQDAKPWKSDPHYFKRCGGGVGTGAASARRCSSLQRSVLLLHCCRVRISALALLKMAMHAKSGGNIEVMGVMQVRRAAGAGEGEGQQAGMGGAMPLCRQSLQARGTLRDACHAAGTLPGL